MRELSRFVGREADLRGIAELFERGERLVTLVGPPGMGKTRLAAHWASTAAQRVAADVWVVDLTQAPDVGSALNEVAAAIGAPSPAEGAAELARALEESGRSLLVLDNCEHLLPSLASAVDLWLEEAPDLHVLATSRERLRVPGERCWELGALDPEAAVAMLIDRGERVRGDWDPGAQEREVLRSLVEGLERIPLAIELAAARLSVMGSSELADRIGAQLDLLSHGPRSRDDRQRTLRGAIAWSVALLDEQERATFEACAIFAGGFSAAEAEEIIGPNATETLQSLRDKSLLRSWEPPELPGTLRLGTYESIRELADERLAESGHGEELARRHARAYARLADELARLAAGGDVDAAHRIGVERANLRAVIERAHAGSDHELRRAAVRALLALEHALPAQRGLSEVQAYLESMAASAWTDDAEQRSRMLLLRGRVRRAAGRHAEAVEDLREAVALASAGGVRAIEAQGLVALGRALKHVPDEAKQKLERARALFAMLGDRMGQAISLAMRAEVHGHAGEPAEERECLQEALVLFEQIGAERWLAATHCVIAEAELERGELDAAESALARADALRARVSAWEVDAVHAYGMGALCHERGALDEAARWYAEGRDIHRRVGSRAYAAVFSGYLGVLRFERGDPWGALVELEEARSVLASASDHRHGPLFTAFTAAVRAQLGRLDEARALFGDEGALPPSTASAVETLRGFVDLAVGDLEAARRRLSDAAVPARSWIDARHAARLLARAIEAAETVPRDAEPVPRDALLVEARGRWFVTPDGTVVECRRRPVARRLLLCLAERRLARPGEPISRSALFEAGWPGERIREESAKNRLHVAVSQLRRLGLRDALVWDGEGYLIRADVPLRFVSGGSPTIPPGRAA